MRTFASNKDFIDTTLIRLYRQCKFKYCSNLKLGALVELKQQRLDGTIQPAAWITDDIKYVCFGDHNKAYFFDRELLIRISDTKVIKYYEATKTYGFHLDLHELEEYCTFSY